MKTLASVTSILVLSIGGVAAFAEQTELNTQQIERSLASSVDYSARSSYKWGDATNYPSVTNVSKQSVSQSDMSSSYKWGAPGGSADVAVRENTLAVSGELRVEQSAYKWGIKSDVEQSAY